MTTPIDTNRFSSELRSRSIDLVGRRLLMTNFSGTEQEQDLTEPANCGGLGRVRHFRRGGGIEWPCNPLPMEPAHRALGLPNAEMLRAQVFQNAACNWRCWYCFVPFDLLNANEKHAQWVTVAELLDAYMAQPNPPAVIDLTGGQPDLVPEWIIWTMQELRARELERRVYLWSDDNLSNDYFWRFLSDADRETMADYTNYGRVCCFKGFNAESFAFNTRADATLFTQQFTLMKRLATVGIDLYAYATFTTPTRNHIADDMARFVDSLQAIHPNLPLRTVPLNIQVFTPAAKRIHEIHTEAMHNQHYAVAAWQNELGRRFTQPERTLSMADVNLR